MTIIRRPDFAGGGITDDERAAMKVHSGLWISRVMRTKTVDQAAITDAVKELYRVSGLDEPKAVVVVPSPLVMAFAYGASAAIWHAATDDATHVATFAATDDATRAATLDATRAATDDATLDATLDATFAATFAATDDATRAATKPEKQARTACLFMAGTLGLKCAAKWLRNYQGGAYWGAWDCYLTAARDILGLRLDCHDSYSAWEKCAREAPFRVVHEKFCIVSDFPEFIRVDDRNLPHCENGPSHRWRDGWELYHWHGVRVPDEWISHPGHLTATMALACDNLEQRRVACEILGWDKMLTELNVVSIDKDPDPEIGELLEVDIPDIGREKFIRVQCGTGRQFAIPVPTKMTTALQANAWTWGLKADDYKPEIRT